MRADDILRFVWVADPQISPDGLRIAFVHVAVDHADDSYRTAIWLCELSDRGAASAVPRL